MSKYLKKITQLFPDWTQIYKEPEKSCGGAFINAFASFLDNIHNIIVDLLHIESLEVTPFEYEGLNISKIDFVSKLSISFTLYSQVKEITYIDKGQKIKIDAVDGAYQFFASSTPVCYYDEADGVLYVNKIVDEISLDGKTYSATQHHVWGPYDEIGLLIGCPRQPYEKNQNYIYRLRDTYNQFANSSDEKLKNYLYRTLIPFTSQLSDDVIGFVEFTPEFIEKHIIDGQPDDTLEKYLEIASTINHNFDNSYWDVIEKNNLGLKMLPISWNLSYDNIDSKFIQNGVLRESDLELFDPELEEHVDSIDYRIHATTQSNEQITTYPEIPFSYTLHHKEEDPNGEGTDDNISKKTSFYVTAYEKVNLEFDIEANTSYTNIGTTTFQYGEEDQDNTKYIITHTNDQDPAKTLEKSLEVVEGSTDSCKVIDGTLVHFKDEESDTAKVIINLKSTGDENDLPRFSQLLVTIGGEECEVFAEELYSKSTSRYNVYMDGDFLKLAKDDLYVQHNSEFIFNKGVHTNTAFIHNKGIGLNILKKG